MHVTPSFLLHFVLYCVLMIKAFVSTSPILILTMERPLFSNDSFSERSGHGACVHISLPPSPFVPHYPPPSLFPIITPIIIPIILSPGNGTGQVRALWKDQVTIGPSVYSSFLIILLIPLPLWSLFPSPPLQGRERRETERETERERSTIQSFFRVEGKTYVGEARRVSGRRESWE